MGTTVGACAHRHRSVVDVMQSRSSPDPEIMHLLRCILLYWPVLVSRKVEHIPGVLNTAADAMSRNSPQVFQQCVPSAHSQPSTIPVAVSQMLTGEKLHWLSPVWRSMLTSVEGCSPEHSQSLQVSPVQILGFLCTVQFASPSSVGPNPDIVCG